jgi:hypothetical protein
MPILQSWKVLWTQQDGSKTFRRFQDPSPHDAIVFARGLKKDGLKPSIISSNKSWPPTQAQEKNRRTGDMWCPYCIKWRRFRLFRIHKASYTTDAFMRCPICTISTNDYWVRKYNQMIEHITESELIKKLSRE